MRNPYKVSRTAFCTGCSVTFTKMHEMINHRRSHRCGGRFLCDDARRTIDFAHERKETLKEFRRSPYSGLKSFRYITTFAR